MTNYVPINNTILRDIVRCFNSQYWSRFMHKRVGLVFDEKTHSFQSYIQGYRKTGSMLSNFEIPTFVYEKNPTHHEHLHVCF